MSQPPFTMSKYANETDLLRDKCAWLERELAEANICEEGNFRRAEHNLARAEAACAYAVALQEALDVWEGRSCGGDCLAAPCTHCDGTQRIPGRGALLEGLLEEAVGEIEGVEVEYGDTGPKRLSVEIRAALAKNPINGEVARGAMAPRVEDDARARGPESAHSSSGAAEHAPNAGLVDPPSSPTHDEQLTVALQDALRNSNAALSLLSAYASDLDRQAINSQLAINYGVLARSPLLVRDVPRTVQQQEKT